MPILKPGQRRPQVTKLMKNTLYSRDFEHDACGVGMVANLDAKATHQTVADALTILENLEHRGASGADVNSGDGAGITVKIPDEFLRAKALELGVDLGPAGTYGVAMWFFNQGSDVAAQRTRLGELAATLGLRTVLWRDVPTNSSNLGPTALSAEPAQHQQFLESVQPSSEDRFEAALFAFRKMAEHNLSLYASSTSSRTLIYKGMLTAPQLRTYFPDLDDPRFSSAIALVHSRFSTNTFPSWELAQPFRFIAHNGEINTVRSNRNWMIARESLLESDLFPVPVSELTPILSTHSSDSGSFDEVAELLTLGGRSLPHAVLMMIPEAWERSTSMNAERRDFYRFHSALMEPWDGPASVSFTDGRIVGAVLDRNGLRPARYWVTSDNRVIFSSEVGVLPIDPSIVKQKGRLKPGRMFLVDIEQGRIIEDDELKFSLAERQPYGTWLDEQQVSLDDLAPRPMLTPQHHSVLQHQRLFGYSEEDLRLILRPMASAGEEPLGSMGNDAALPVLSKKNHSVYDFFTQLFAQVTNPPLDAIREELVTSTRIGLGPHKNLLLESPAHCRQIVLSSPILSVEDLAKIRYIHEASGAEGFKSVALDGLFPVSEDDKTPGQALSDALCALADEVVRRVRDGCNIIILSDRNASLDQAPIPSLLATAAVHNRLIVEHLRSKTALVVESGDALEVHHAALLLGFGASAVCPYLSYDTVDDLVSEGLVAGPVSEARYRYAKALTKGIVKIMSKMGVSTVASYIGSQLFEVVGIGEDVLAQCFAGMHSRIGGKSFDEVAADVLARHDDAFVRTAVALTPLESAGEYQWRRDGEAHLFNPRTVFKLQHATRSKRFEIFKQYTELVDDQEKERLTLRSLLRLKKAAVPLNLDDVEPASEILKRFSTGAMSYGSISAEAHETLAIAMNRLGAKSNTGEGGEDRERFDTSDPQHNRRSAIKQVASGRFGVTSEYLVNADDLQIKIAQGAKPGEGGQLAGVKIYPWIAKTRHSTVGVGLISPPPHHDIYSIEDLKQLIYDLKNANENARVHVKLVSEQGVGTIAAGVAKAHADVILISGHDGGTGAAPLTSLKHAGTPWEIGLAETQQTLAANGLRDRVVLQVDGQLKTGRDVIIGALLGAEEFGFATAPLVVSGCIMMRVCHLDTCPVGIATQNPELRARFSGTPEFVENFFEFIAQEVREYLSQLGVKTLEEIIGRTDLLEAVLAQDEKSGRVDVGQLLLAPIEGQTRNTRSQQHGLESAFDRQFLDDALACVERGESFTFSGDVRNVHRTVGTLTGSALTRKFEERVLPNDTVTLNLQGSAGQSLGAFLPSGVTIRLEGDANDYVAKGLSGGRVIVVPPVGSSFSSQDNIIAGNVIGYGATGGEILLSGVVGERLGVRNSGATIVVEGAGDHACEYMTGGQVLILGPTGRNVAAGMSGGTLYLYDPWNSVDERLSSGVFDVEPLEVEDDEIVRDLLLHYVKETGSAWAQHFLDTWREERMNFLKIESEEYRKVRDREKQRG